MSSAVWQRCHGDQHIKPFKAQVWRIVEAQHVSASRKLVDSAREHEILEDMIELAKPNPSYINQQQRYHYLLYTPFRYPPLSHGSRFGRRFEPAIWYGSATLPAALAEVAFYRLVFLTHTSAMISYTEVMLSAFAVTIKTDAGIDLTKKPFVNYRASISSPTSYVTSQALGTTMRNAQVIAFCYFSARAKNEKNVGLYSPTGFASKNPLQHSLQTWHCGASRDRVTFIHNAIAESERYEFLLEDFLVAGHIPVPPAWMTEE